MDQLKPILAKYWIAIVCGVIALAAVIASFWPLADYHDQQLTKLKASAANYATGENLLTKKRNQPLAPGQTTPSPLKIFPSPSVIKSGEELRDTLQKESHTANQVVVDLNAHKPLLPGVLPNPLGSAPLDYRAAYNQRVGTKGTLFTQVLQAGSPPTVAEIKQESDRLWVDKYQSLLVKDSTGKAYNEESVKASYDTEVAALPSRMRQERAKMCRVYAAGDALPIDAVVSNVVGLPPDPRKIWWSQLQLWISEDVAQGIADANNRPVAVGQTDVTYSAVKRILKLDTLGEDQSMLFIGSPRLGVAAAPTVAVDPNAPVTLPESNSPVPTDFKTTPSGRISCPMYDVVQFKLDLVVAAKDIPWVIDCLSRNRLITVVNVESIVAEDGKVAEKNGFFYGQQPLVRVSLKCEALFLREWTAPLMPDTIKRLLITLTGTGTGT